MADEKESSEKSSKEAPKDSTKDDAGEYYYKRKKLTQRDVQREKLEELMAEPVGSGSLGSMHISEHISSHVRPMGLWNMAGWL